MTTIVNNPGPERVVERVVETDGSAGWAVAVLILLAAIALGAYYFYYHRSSTTSGGTNINVTLPAATTPAATTP